MAEHYAHGLTEDALDALVDLFVAAVDALTSCEGAAARCLPEERHLPLRFTELYHSYSGQIAAILAANGKAMDVVGTWISMRNRLLVDLHAVRPGQTGNVAHAMLAVGDRVRAGFAAVLTYALPQATHQELHGMQESLGKALDNLRRF